MDLQYAMALVTKKQNVTLYQVGDIYLGKLLFSFATLIAMIILAQTQVLLLTTSWTRWMVLSVPIKVSIDVVYLTTMLRA